MEFRHVNGARGRKYMPETMGSGVAFLDYDNDGWQDLLCVNSTRWPGDAGPAATPRLFHNDRNGRFTDVTARSGLDREIYGMGAAIGDFDNDGYDDVYLTAVGPNRLFRNTLGDAGSGGHPLFRDVTQLAGLAGATKVLPWNWSTSAAWLDYDRDGKLDLFVCSYVRWSPGKDVPCIRPDGLKEYCTPVQYTGLPCVLYRNEGGGKFRDVSAQTGIRSGSAEGKSLGVAVADFNSDGWPDIAVANDTRPNFLFLNQGGRRFEEQGLESGIGVPETGKSRAGMGIDAADWENRGRFGLLVGNFSGEALSLFRNDGQAFFTDEAHPRGMAEPSLLFLTFGLFFFDYDLDGWLDALAANGYIDEGIDAQHMLLTYRERLLLFHNEGGARFRETGLSCGPAMSRPLVGRGAAWADLDNDGDPDFAVLSNGEGVSIYRNEGAARGHWVRFHLVGRRSNRNGIGALVRVTSGAVTRLLSVHSGGSYLSECQRDPIVGLGRAAQAETVEVTWPSGAVTRGGPLAADRVYVVDEARGVLPGS